MIPVIFGLIPVLVKAAEAIFPASGSGKEKHAWVKGFLDDVISIMNKNGILPPWAKDAAGPLEEIILHLIEVAVEKL